jgi:hypothetical protein
MSDWRGDDEEDDDYFSETEDGVELTGKEPKFVRIESMQLTPAEISTKRVDDLILMYRQARDQLATDRKGYKAREAAVKTHMSIISMILRDRGDQLGVDSFKTDNGTAFRNLKEKFPIENWESLVEYIKQTGNFHIVQKRVSPLAVKDIRNTEGALPPGVGYLPEVEFSVRAPTNRKSK